MKERFKDPPIAEIYSTFSIDVLEQEIAGAQERIQFWLKRMISNQNSVEFAYNLIGDHYKWMIVAYDLIQDKLRIRGEETNHD